MKTISIFLALINSITAGLLLVFTLTSRDVQYVDVLWLLTKVIAAVVVIAIGALTWLGSVRATRPGLLPMSSLLLVALGAGTVVWTFHLGILHSDMEYYMAWFGGSLMAQGVTSLAGFAGESKGMIAS